MKKLPQFLLTVAMLLSANLARAYDVIVNGICYDLDEENKTATVTEAEENKEIEGELTIPSSIGIEGSEYEVTTIGEYAFSWGKITAITLPNSITSIDRCAFRFTPLSKIVLSDNLITIGRNVFEGCNYLKAIDIPESVKTIDAEAFYHCQGLTEIVIPNSVTTIGYNCFWMCVNLNRVVISNSVTQIDANTFGDCYSLKECVLPNSLKSINFNAFKGCTSLEVVNIPNSVEKIMECAFEQCESLREINVDSSNKHYSSEDGILFNKEKTLIILYPEGKGGKAYTIPNSVNYIGYNAFPSNNPSKIIIPDSVAEIGSLAFGLGLISINISGSVNMIEEDAFYCCDDLKEVYVDWKKPISLPNYRIFDEEYICDATLYVPQGSASSYRQVAPWNLFGKIVEYLPGAVENIDSDSRDLPCEAFSLTGVRVAEAENLEHLKKQLSKGMYVVRFANGESQRIVKF